MFVFPRFWERIPFKASRIMRSIFPIRRHRFYYLLDIIRFFSPYSDYAYAKNVYLQGKAEIVEGAVSNFKPELVIAVLRLRAFASKTSVFTYSDYEERAG